MVVRNVKEGVDIDGGEGYGAWVEVWVWTGACHTIGRGFGHEQPMLYARVRTNHGQYVIGICAW